MNGTLTRNDTPAPATASEVAQAVTGAGSSGSICT